MRRVTFCLLISILFFPIYLQAQALSGSYTIGSGGAYTTISDAITALKNNGVSGPVTFNILPGTYDEQLVLNFSITGSTTADTVVFQSSTGNAADDTLQFSTGSTSPRYVLTVENTANVSFKNLTFQYTSNTYTVLSIGGTLNNVKFIGNIFNGDNPSNYHDLMVTSPTISSSSGDIVFDGNTFNDAYVGVYLIANNTPGLQIINNTFSNQGTAIQLNKGSASVSFDAPIIESNVFDSISSYVLQLRYCSNNLKIIDNKSTNLTCTYGIDLENCTGTSSNYGLIANNILESDASLADTKLIYLSNSSYQKIYFNSTDIEFNTYNRPGSINIALVGGSNINIENNIAANRATGKCFYTNSSTNVTLSDYNDYYANGSTLISWNGTGYGDLSSFQGAVSSQEQHSLEAKPFYASTADLTPNSGWINNKGDNLVVAGDLLKDFNGAARSTTNPDMGAIEYTPNYSPYTAMGGPVYTIGSSGADFTTLTDAILQMEERGVSRGLTFQFLDGSYNEQISFDYIPGLNQSNPLIIESQSLDSSKVDIHYSGTSANNYVLQLANVKYVTFKDLRLTPDDYTHSVIVSIGTNANDDNFINDNFYQPNLSAYNPDVNSTSGVYTENLIFDGCQFNGGNNGIYLQGNGSNQSKNIQISNCTFSKFPNNAVYLKSYDSPYIYKNEISNSGYGLDLIFSGSSGTLKIIKNKITSCGTAGIDIQGGTFSSTSPALVANNFIASKTNYYEVYLSGSSGEPKNINFYYNSFNSLAFYNNGADKTLYIDSGTNIKLVNNIFKGDDEVLVEPSGAVTTSDYNDFYTTGTNIVKYNGTDYTSLSAYQTASSKDSNSISVDPGFTSFTDLHASTAAVSTGGTPSINTVVSDDIDGELRDNSTPSIGADEFTTTASSGAMAGTYSIGAGKTYTSISAAINDLRLRGISGVVDFKIDNGTYSEQLNFPSSISGSSSSNNIIFESSSGSASDVAIDYTASSYSSNYVINLNRASYITFKNVTISAHGTNYATCVLINSGASNLNFIGDIFNGVSTTQSSSNFALIYSSGSTCNSLTFQNNTFSNGSEGIDIQSGSATYATAMDIENNTFNNVYDQAVYVFDYGSPIVKSNNISNSNIGIDLGSCDNSLNVEKNKISGISDRGIIIDFCTGTSSAKGLTANNFIQSTDKGIYLTSSSYQQIYYNSVSINESPSGSNTNSDCFTSSSSNTNNFLEDNLFINNENGLAAFFINNSSFSTTDYNDYYSGGSNLVYFNGSNYQNISSYKTASGTESHSTSKNVTFTSLTDLHLSGSSVGNSTISGTPLSAITTDIDGDTRSSTYPYMGADEITASPLPVELKSFNALVLNNKVKLKWKTATEVNNYGFQVERRSLSATVNAGGKAQNTGSKVWTKIGFVKGAGNSNSSKGYFFIDKNLTPSSYSYRLKMIDNSGSFKYSKVVNITIKAPDKYLLYQNYPNPFNPTTTIKYSLPEALHVTLDIYNSLGQKVRTLVNNKQPAGYHTINFNAEDLASGIYFYVLRAGNKFTAFKKMILIK